jgi:opacity protein-like surface antigen
MRDLPLSYLLAFACLTLSSQAFASEFYASGTIGISGATAESGGSTQFFQNTGSDSDSSPVYGGTLGFAIPVADMLPIPWEDQSRRWRMNLPTWDLRFEFEGLAGRDYEMRTDGGDGYFAEVQNWAVLNNVWMDLPIRDPITWAFGRVPLLEPVTIYAGVGIGLGVTEVSATDNVSAGSETNYKFAWQAGAGIAYEVTEYVTLSAGYRYFDLGQADLTLYGAGPDPFGDYTLDVQAHEFIAGVRVSFYSLPWPMRE